MKYALFLISVLIIFVNVSHAQQNQGNNIITKAGKKIKKAKSVITIFQPYLLKARQLFYDGKDLVAQVKQTGKEMNSNSEEIVNENSNEFIQNYLPDQALPINNPETVNADGTGNWGNQNNGLYGNCLDLMTGTVMGLAEAEESPAGIDIIFIAANGSYQFWSPHYARNDVAAEYTSRSTQESVSKWAEINETEIAETKISSGQFDKIQTNNQIMNAVKNAQNYASSITLFGKLDGKVLAVKTELEGRTVYGLIKITKHFGTDGSNGYLKIQVKAQGLGNGGDGQIDPNIYLR